MATTTMLIVDKSFRIVIPWAVRMLEGIDVGDSVRVSVKRCRPNRKTEAELCLKTLVDESLLTPGALAEIKERVRREREKGK